MIPAPDANMSIMTLALPQLLARIDKSLERLLTKSVGTAASLHFFGQHGPPRQHRPVRSERPRSDPRCGSRCRDQEGYVELFWGKKERRKRDPVNAGFTIG
jgi:hypothetical protein